jgi:hypothetical protein
VSAAHKRPTPLTTRAYVVSTVSALAALCVELGAPKLGADLTRYSDVVAFVVLTAGPTVTAWLARRHVTPSADPRDNDGVKLVRVDTAAVVQTDIASALAAAEAIFPAAPQ